MMDALDTLIAAKMTKPSGSAGQALVWDTGTSSWIGSAVKPSQLAQEGATDGQAMIWSASGGKWQPGSGGSLQKISEVTLSVARAAIDTSDADFVNALIPQTYSNLIIRGVAHNDQVSTGTQELRMQFNADTGGNYDYSVVDNVTQTNAGGAASYMLAGYLPGGAVTAARPGHFEIVIPNYRAGSTFHRGGHSEGGHAAVSEAYDLWRSTWRWASVSAVNRIKLFCNSGNFAAGTRIMLYGEL